MNTTDLIPTIICEYITINKQIPNINNGGCGIFAERLYHILKKLRLNPTFVVATNDADNMKLRIKHNLDLFRDWRLIMGGETYPFIDHIVISVNNMLLDSEGIYKPDNSVEIVKNVSLKVIQKWNSNTRLWNPEFNRGHIKEIENKLEKCYTILAQDLEVSNI